MSSDKHTGKRMRRHHHLPLALVCLAALALSIAGAVRICQLRSEALAEHVGTRLAHRTVLVEQQASRALLSHDGLALKLRTASLVRAMTPEQKVAQLFFVTPEGLLAGRSDDVVTAAGEMTREALAERPVGGIIYFQQNLLTPEQTKEMLARTSAYAREALDVPILLDVDEEGGTVSRVGGNPGFGIANVGNMSAVGATQDPQQAREVATHIGSYLHELGFTADFAPVADVADNPDSDTMVLRSFGADPALVAQMVAAQVEGFTARGIICCAKHFPGIGAAEGDSHEGAIYTHKDVDALLADELVPFSAAIEAGVPMVMVGHISCPEVTGTDLPASVSPSVMGNLLRDRLGFTGVVVTDSLGMGAIVERYGYDRVAVEAFLAGADALLMPADFDAAYQGMLDAVASGEVSRERLDASVARIVGMKLAYEPR